MTKGARLRAGAILPSRLGAKLQTTRGLMEPPPSAARRAPPRRRLSCRPAARKKPDGDRDQRQNEQHVNEPACDVEGCEAKDPKYEKHNRDCPQEIHGPIPFLAMAVPAPGVSPAASALSDVGSTMRTMYPTEVRRSR